MKKETYISEWIGKDGAAMPEKWACKRLVTVVKKLYLLWGGDEYRARLEKTGCRGEVIIYRAGGALVWRGNVSLHY